VRPVEAVVQECGHFFSPDGSAVVKEDGPYLPALASFYHRDVVPLLTLVRRNRRRLG